MGDDITNGLLKTLLSTSDELKNPNAGRWLKHIMSWMGCSCGTPLK